MTDEQKPAYGDAQPQPEAEETEISAEESGEEAAEPHPPAKLERLQKILAQAGVASRRAAEQLITEGRVQVNGQTVTELGTKADPARDHIRVDGKLLHGAERLRYFVLNKPRGYVTTVKDPEGRPTVMEFFAKTGERLYPVGRLDFQSEGLLLVTNDGPLANALTRAASGVEKTYLVKVAGQPTPELIDQLRSGVAIDRGRRGEGRVQTAPARIRQVRPGNNPWFEVVLIEGRNRELRKMFEEIGHHVEKIRRVGYGPLVLDLEPGKMRELEPAEVEALHLTAAGKLRPRPVKASRMLPKDAGLTADERAAKAERAARFKRGGRPGGPPGRQSGRGFGRTSERTGGRPARRTDGRDFKPGFKPKSESGSEPKFGHGFEGRSGSKPGSKQGFKPGFKSGYKSSFQSRTESGSRREETPDRRRAGSQSGPERSVRGDRPAHSSKPFGKPAYGERGKSFGKSPGKPFSKPTFDEHKDRPARPGKGRPADASSQPFKGKSFGKPAFGERDKSFGKASGKPAFGDRGKSQGKSQGKPFGKSAFGGRGKPYGKPSGGPDRSKGPFRPGGKRKNG